jgi:MFS family permease
MRIPTGLRALDHRDYRLFFAGQLISLSGTWMQRVAQSWLVLELTDSPFKLGLITALQSAPMLCFAFVAGAIADRLPKRRVLIGTQTALMGQAFVLALLVWSGSAQYWHVAVLAICYGLANTLDMPTRQAFIVEMASKEDLPNAIALNSSMVSVARMVGPAVAGLLVDRYGVASAFGLNGLSFLAVILALGAIRAEGLPGPAQGTTVREDIGAGLRYAARTPLVALPLGLLSTVGLFVINHNVLVPLLARDVLREGAHGFGLLMAAVGVGAIVGALGVATRARGRPSVFLLLGTAGIASGLTLLLAVIRTFWAAALVLTLVGFAQIVFLASCNTTLQLGVPDRMRGRIMSLYAFVWVGVTPLGSLFVGTIAEWFGVAAAYAAGGGVGLVCVLGLGLLWKRGQARAESSPEGRPRSGSSAGAPRDSA